MNTFFSFLLSLTFVTAAMAQTPPRAFYLAADVCGNEATSQYFLLYVESDYKFLQAPPIVTTSCPASGLVKQITSYAGNHSAVAMLNTKTGGCQDPVFWDMEAVGVAPAGSVIMVFVSPNPEISVLNSNTFSDLCGSKRVYVAFGNYYGSEPFFNNNHPLNALCGNYYNVDIKIGNETQHIVYDPKRLAPQDGAYVALDGRENIVRYGVANACTCPGLSCPADPIAGIAGQTTVCEGGFTTLTAMVQTPGSYSYIWNNGATGSTVQVSPAVTSSYTVTVTNSTLPQCSFVMRQTIEVFQYPSITIDLMSDDGGAACYGEKAYLRWGVVDPVVEPLTYQWIPPSPSITLSSEESITLNESTAGLYHLQINYANGCIRTEPYEVSYPALTPVNICTNAPVCLGENVKIQAQGEWVSWKWRGPDNYQADEATLDLSTPIPGVYSVAVTDINGCTFTGEVAVAYKICQEGVLSAIASASPASCNGVYGGSATVIAGGGNLPYKYNWSHTTSDDEPDTYSDLPPGDYTITVTDINGASVVASVSVPTGSPLSGTATAIHSTCGNNNGSISVSLSNGTAPFTWVWSDGGGNVGNRVNLGAGTYGVTVSDNNGCQYSTLIAVANSAGISSLQAEISSVSCYGGNNGSINMSVNGGTAPYSYTWFDGSNFQQRNGLTAGTYSVTVTDVQGCTRSGLYYIVQPTLLSISLNTTNNSCGGNIGAITTTVSGGTPPYSFNWNDIVVAPEPQNRTGLSAGIYTVTVTDANNCTQWTNSMITQPPTPSMVAMVTNTGCNGNTGSINITTTGGVAPYTYNWQDITSGNEPEDRNNLPQGTYFVTVTGANGCTQARSWSITTGDLLSVSHNQVNTTCGLNNGSISVQAAGGIPLYNYDWAHIPGTSNAASISNLASGSYSLIVTAGNGCTVSKNFIIEPSLAVIATYTASNTVCGLNNGSISIQPNGSSAPYNYNWTHIPGSYGEPQTLNGLPPGNYSVTVTAASGCTAAFEYISVLSSTGLNITPTVKNASCNINNGSIALSASGVSGPYNYDWAHITGSNNSPNLTALAPGSYTVTVSASGSSCTAAYTGTIVQKGVPVVNSEADNTACNANTGAIYLFVNGGATPYTYDWAHITGANNPQNISSLAGGGYNVTVSDVNGCSKTKSATVGINNIAITGVITAPTSGNNGAIQLSVSGSGAPFNYNWSHLVGTSDPQNVSGLTAGTYVVTVTGSGSCTGVKSFTLSASGLTNSGANTFNGLKYFETDSSTERYANSVQDKFIQNQPYVFPNPTASAFTLMIPETLGNYDITIFDPLSRKVMEILSNKGNITVFPEGWSTGVYKILVTSKEGIEHNSSWINVIYRGD